MGLFEVLVLSVGLSMDAFLVGFDILAELTGDYLGSCAAAYDDLTIEVLYALPELLVGLTAARRAGHYKSAARFLNPYNAAGDVVIRRVFVVFIGFSDNSAC